MTLRKAAALREWALIDAGGGAVVDLLPNGEEVLSARKVAALRRNALVIYIKARRNACVCVCLRVCAFARGCVAVCCC